MKAKLLTMLILITGLYGGLSANAQTQSISNPFQALESNPYLMPPTPDVAAFLNYGQYSVSQASGKVDITIPIYEIRTRELSCPITLSYIGGGIKVTDQASWAGLGWVLNAGGVVNHTVQGLPDKNWSPELPTAEDIREDYDHQSLYKTIAPVNGGLNGTDKMRDRYDYSFGQGGGTFYIASYEEYLQVPYTENKIKRLLNPSQTQTAGFVITDDKGISYYFEKPENSTVLSTSYNHSNSQTHPLSEEYTYNSAWYLTKIVSMNQKDSINFIYGTDSESYIDHSLSHSYSVTTDSRSLNVERHMTSTVNTRQVNSTPVLQKIVFEQGYIIFESSADRKDNRSYRITGVKVYNSNDDLIREVDFSHSYFGGNRLKLDEVTFKGRDGKIYDSVEFEYYNESFPIISWIPNHYGHLSVGSVSPYYSQDYMGYYNGAENKSLIGFFPEDDYNHANYAANRNHSAEHAKVHSLKSMTYMSGAQTEFRYDTEDYIRPRNPGIKIKEILATDPTDSVYLKKVYSYSGGKQATSFPYESQMFVDYSINIVPDDYRAYETKTYNSEPLVHGYESGWQALYKRIEERIIDSTNPTDTMLVVRTYDITSSDFEDTGYYLDEYGRTTEAHADWLAQLRLLPLDPYALNYLTDDILLDKYNVPGYFVNNDWEGGDLLKEEVYKMEGNNYELCRSMENTYTRYLYNTRVPVGIYSKGILFSCSDSIRPANWGYLSVPSIFNFYFFDICVSTGWKKLTSSKTIEYADGTQNTIEEAYSYASINRTTDPHSYCTLYSRTCKESEQEWRDVSFYKYVSDSNMLDQNVKDSILSRNF